MITTKQSPRIRTIKFLILTIITINTKLVFTYYISEKFILLIISILLFKAIITPHHIETYYEKRLKHFKKLHLFLKIGAIATPYIIMLGILRILIYML